MKKNRMNKILELTIMAMLTAVSVVLMYVSRANFPWIPLPFLEYDAADIPVLIGAIMLGPVQGLIILFAVCLIQAITVSAHSGWIGFIMHFFASAVLILIPSILYRKKKSIKSLIVGLILGVLGMTVVMVPLNLVFMGLYTGIQEGTDLKESVGRVVASLVPAIIPFNLSKGAINAAVTFAVFTPLSPVLKKYTKI